MNALKLMLLVATLPLFSVLAASAMDVYNPPFPELVISSDAIACGTISVDGSDITLSVDHALKGNVSGTVSFRPDTYEPTDPTRFRSGEHVLVFLNLNKQTGDYVLRGSGDAARWPKNQPG